MGIRRFRVGVDIGGTFTDLLVLRADNSIARKKILSTPDDYSRGVQDGLREVLAEEGLDGADLDGFIHGTTVATNAVMESSGPPVGLLTTRGFRDVLEIGRCRWGPDIYDLGWRKPRPLIPRGLRLEVGERMSARGEALEAPDRDQVVRALTRLRAAGIGSVAVCLLNSYANPSHERLIKEWAAAACPELTMCVSHEVLAEIQEFERTSTTAINAYLMPVVDRYLDKLREALASVGYEGRLLVMQSNGGVITAELARRQPVHIVESGPAAGVLACCYLARQTDEPNLIAFDMGGTTAKASLIEGNRPFQASEYHVGGGMNRAAGAAAGGGHVIRVPSIEIAEVGAGGGSVAWLDAGGALRVGPRSAGAAPGPACYGLGGTEPTVTDAYAILGYISPEAIAGGARQIFVDRAREAVAAMIARPSGLGVDEAAYGIYSVATSNMIRAVRAVTVERGREARDYALVAFGGAGPLHAAEIARAMGLRRVIVPVSPGLFSALGLLMADVQHVYSRTVLRTVREMDGADVGRLNHVFAEFEGQALTDLASEGFGSEQVALDRSVTMHYLGQSYELVVEAPRGTVDVTTLEQLATIFCAEHERVYGYREDVSRVQLVAARLRARGLTAKPSYAEIGRQTMTPGAGFGPGHIRNAYFGPAVGWRAAPVVTRGEIPADGLPGPAIVEELDTTVLVPVGCVARLDAFGNVVMVLPTGEDGDGPAADAARVDPITLELVKNSLSSITDEMCVTLARTARSLGVKDARDFSVALCNARGELVTGGVGLAVHLGAIPAAMEAVLAAFPGGLDPGDVVMMNDPYSGGMHLPDMFLFKPIHVAGELLGFAAVVAHMADIGGRVPGGNAADSTEIYQEGIRIPPLRLYARGELDRTWVTLLGANVRQSATVIGDLLAEVAACNTAQMQLVRLAGRLGPATLRRYMAELIEYGERMARAALRELRPGRYTFVDHMDDDGLGGAPVRIEVALEVGGDAITVDFAGTAPQVRGAINAPLSITRSAVFFVVKAIVGQEIPNNAGFQRVLTVVAPEGTVVHMAFPAACAARAVTAYRVTDALFGAFAQALPDRVPAAGDGGPAVISVGGEDELGVPFVFMEVISGAFGGRPAGDGLEGVASPIANTQNTSCELIEANFPLRVERYGFVPDTGGPGRHRGGMAIQRDVRFLGRRAVLQIRSDRSRLSPWGLAGGAPGAPSENRLSAGGRGGRWRRLPSKVVVDIAGGDMWSHRTAGGGGWGDPSTRDRAAIAQDLTDEKVSRRAAAWVYGLGRH
ncbi:MAG: hydantoinase B/oxoprolinase family protein [Candidatus Rokubacteria bacterium]|nr:hydantoinase B/oxoprolinase family protein [Candidatus Rokubacteria bacterium]